MEARHLFDLVQPCSRGGQRSGRTVRQPLCPFGQAGDAKEIQPVLGAGYCLDR